ncbi:MAG: Fic family protein [Acidobacteriota bacterium]
MKAAKEADIVPADHDESISQMEPLLLAESNVQRPSLAELAFELAKKSSAFRSALPHNQIQALAGLVRSMNCYYSNLIEGHNTHPVDIERALQSDYSTDSKKRDLQMEAKAHIAVQAWVDEGGLRDRSSVTQAGITELHRRFCEQLPDELLWIEDPASKTRVRVIPGSFRKQHVQVGRHVPVCAGAIPRFMERFEQVYSRLGKAECVLSAAAAHHRLLWIHPFLDGNGRVARLMSHAMLLDSLDTGSVWSVARGLARRVDEYRAHLSHCDQSRKDSRDGRGPLSEKALTGFTRFFLEVCLDQVAFMVSLVQPEKLRTRVLMWAEEEIRLGTLPANSGSILEAILYRGELPRGEADRVIGTGARQARRITSALLEKGVLTSEDSRAPLRLAFPATLAGRWLPGLFPEYGEN